MQPFRIICETCRSRLKIRSADVIGEIHACPKCGSMVQIVPPAGWDPSVASSAEQASAPGEAALTLSTTASVIIPAGAIDDLSALDAPAAEVPIEVATPALPPAEAGSPVLLWVAGGVVAVFLVGGLAWSVWPRGSDKPSEPSPSAVATSDQQAGSEQSPEPKAVTPAAKQAEPKIPSTETVQAAANQTAKPAEAQAAPTAVKPVEPKPPAQSPVEAKAERAKPVDAPKSTVVEAKPVKIPASAAATPAKAIESAASAPDHSPVLKFDPLDFDPARLGTNSKAGPDSNASTSSVPDKLPAEAVAAGAANSEAAANVEAVQAAPADAGKGLPRVANASIAVRRGPPADGAPRAAGQLLATRVKSLQVTDMPLVRFIETLSGVAGTGITLDPIALEQVGISPQATVSINVQDAPLQAILHDALAQRRLDVAEQGGQPRVILPKADELHTIDYDVGDLAAGKDAAALGRLIEQFVAPAMWKSAGGKGTLEASGTTLHIEQSDAVRRELVIFCERLRLARGLAVKSKYPAAMLSIESPYQRLSAKLSEHTTFTFLPWTRLADVVRNWQDMSGLLVLVDWSALAEAELSPTSPVACSAIDRSWQESLDGVLEPLGLGWWAVDGGTIQITSLAALDKIQRIEFYQVSAKLRVSLASNQALIDSLQKELAESAGKQGKPAPAHMELDEPSGRLIVLASPTTHRDLSRRLGGDSKP